MFPANRQSHRTFSNFISSSFQIKMSKQNNMIKDMARGKNRDNKKRAAMF